MELINIVKENLNNLLKENGYILDEVVYELDNKQMFLRLIIDKDGVVNIDDCITVTHLVNPVLDDIKELDDSYILDVCSKEKGCE